MEHEDVRPAVVSMVDRTLAMSEKALHFPTRPRAGQAPENDKRELLFPKTSQLITHD